jgi:hypothetical protein
MKFWPQLFGLKAFLIRPFWGRHGLKQPPPILIDKIGSANLKKNEIRLNNLNSNFLYRVLGIKFLITRIIS